MTKIFTVFGATGNQGGSVITHVLKNSDLSKEYKIRAVTRNPNKPNAKALADKGCEVVQADLDDKDSIKKVVDGSHTVFAVTDYWNLKNPSKKAEFEQGKTIVDACKHANVQHLIWSTLPHIEKMSNGKYKKVEHFDSKAEVAEYALEQKVPTSFVVPGVFMSNLKQTIIKQGDQYSLSFPLATNVPFPWFDCPGDTGKFVEGILASKEDTKGKFYSEATEWLTPEEVAKTFTEVTGHKCTANELDAKTWMSYIPQGAEELLENMYVIRDYGYFGPTVQESKDHLEKSKKICLHQPTTLKEYFQKNGPW